MDTKNNFYELLEVIKSASTREILGAYENKITKFNNISKLSDNQINEIKILKIALHVLITPKLRSKYNKYMKLKNNKSINNNQDNILSNNEQDKSLNNNKQDAINQNEPQAINQDMEASLDTLFNVDNTWMKSNSKTNESLSKKNKFENNSIGDRVFSMSQFNKRPGYSSHCEGELRKPLQGREDKTSQITN